MPEERPKGVTPVCANAILSDVKTQLRQALDKQIPPEAECIGPDDDGIFTWMIDSEIVNQEKCLLGTVGDILWIQEPFYIETSNPNSTLYYKADEASDNNLPWKPAKEMPRWASRILVEITRVDCQRIQDISDHDIQKEGNMWKDSSTSDLESNRLAFARWWTAENAKKGATWDKNPWVWVVEFRRLNP